ncbi:MAG TPA: ABC transporter substrate-binding protein [Burkholderiaceae bacterium]|nr:ABC transporter substrate-binding protein [Burkholderiaceae bacterium]
MTIRTTLVAALVALLLPLAAQAQGKTLRYASAFDPQTMDPHALALLYQTRVGAQIYEGLVNRAKDYKLEPSLAASWEMVNPTTWRFKLRQGVKFHDGAPFSADDAVFSIERALDKASQRKNQMLGITGAKKVDALTIDVITSQPDAVLPEKLWLVAMMSKPWAEKHGVTRPQDYNARQETFAVRNANGTGPFALVRYEADVRTVLKANPAWWGRSTAELAGRFGGSNLDEVHYQVIQSDATRLAALQSGQVDFVIDPPFQDLARLKTDKSLKVSEVDDIGTQYLAMNMHSAELAGSDAKGRNPFKDVRVRRALQLAIDTDLIVKQVLRGEGKVTGSFFSPLIDGYLPEFEQRPKADPAAARALLKEAGYENGFSVQMDCVNVAWRASVCQAATSMLEKVGIRASLVTSPSSVFFPKLTQGTGYLMEFGWSAAPDPWGTLQSLVRTNDGFAAGAFNAGRYSNPKLDALVDAIRIEPNLAKRRQMTQDALRILAAELPLVPLYRRQHNWVMRPGIDVVQWPNDVLELRWVTMR